MESGLEWLSEIWMLQLEKKTKESDGESVEIDLKKQTSVWYIAGKIILTLYLYLISYFYTLSYPL